MARHYKKQVIRCPDCGSEHICTSGYTEWNGKRRYRCLNMECGRVTFIVDYTKNGYKTSVRRRIIGMLVEGNGVTAITHLLQVCPNCVYSLLRRLRALLWDVNYSYIADSMKEASRPGFFIEWLKSLNPATVIRKIKESLGFDLDDDTVTDDLVFEKMLDVFSGKSDASEAEKDEPKGKKPRTRGKRAKVSYDYWGKSDKDTFSGHVNATGELCLESFVNIAPDFSSLTPEAFKKMCKEVFTKSKDSFYSLFDTAREKLGKGLRKGKKTFIDFFNSVGEILNLKKEPKKLKVFVAEAEMDEMWSYVGSKKNPRWLWWAVDHNTGEALAFHLGDRKHENFDQLMKLLEPFHMEVVYADKNPAYKRLGSEKLDTTNGKTNTIEGYHLALRTWCSRMVRDGCRYSKMEDLHDATIGLVINIRFFDRKVDDLICCYHRSKWKGPQARARIRANQK